MLEINVNGGPATTTLDARSSSRPASLRLDGPPKKWKLHVTNLEGGDTVYYGAIDGAGQATGKVKTLGAGATTTISDRTELWTRGVSSLSVERDSTVINGRRVAA